MAHFRPEAGISPPGPAYSRPAAVIHWATAGLIVLLVPLGIYGAEVDSAGAQTATGVHKALGLAVLALWPARAAWRLTHPAPALPRHVPRAQRATAQLVHAVLYFLLVAIPVAGWIMSSTVPERHPIGLEGIVELPFLPLEADMRLAGLAHGAHLTMGWILVGLVALHVAAAFKHQLVDRDGLIARMWPFDRSPADDGIDRALQKMDEPT